METWTDAIFNKLSCKLFQLLRDSFEKFWCPANLLTILKDTLITGFSALNYNLAPKVVDRFTKLSKIGFSTKCSVVDSSRLFSTNGKICVLGSRLGTDHRKQSILLIFLKLPKSFDSFGNSWGNSYIHFRVIIIYFRFTFGEEKLN